MSENPKRRRKMSNVTYTERITYYDTIDGMKLLERVANDRGISATAALRQLVREEVRRIEGEKPR